ncbi:MAG: MFS transporter [Gammaproteobacteria bacterium]|nr:MFS transporter [Gammaproteobacteria bacterium]
MKKYFSRHMFTILFLGFSSGLPLGLIGSTLQAWYTVSGVSLVTIGWLTLVGQPYAYKFLWAPFLDRWTPLKYGRRRSWILLMQLALAATFAIMAFSHPAKTPLFLAFLALLVAFFSSTQDTAFDAYRTELLTIEERGVGTSVYMVAYRLAMMVSGALALIIAALISWRAMYLIMAACFLGLMWITVISPNPKIEKSELSSLKEAMIAPMRAFFSKKNAVLILVFIMLYKMCDAMALSLNTTFLIRGMGFSLIQIGAISKMAGIVGAVLGSVVGGLLMPYLGVFRALWIFGLLQLSSNLLYAWLAFVGKNILLMGVAIFGEYFCGALASVALIVYLMGLCDLRYTATQYALFSAVAALSRIFIGPVSAVIVQHFGWIDFYIFTAIIGLPALLLLPFL